MVTRVANRYAQIIERIFLDNYKNGMREVLFERSDLVTAAEALKIELPKNLGDVIYSFRYRTELPQTIRDKETEQESWVIRPAGKGKYYFALTEQSTITPNPKLEETKVPNATPGIIDLYALNDEQALLARLRYNRLLDIFTGTTCYSLQSHLRTSVPNVGQVETDELYVGIDRNGAHYVFPVQAKGGRDQLNVVQIEQDFALCTVKFPSLICRPIGAQFISMDLIALFELVQQDGQIVIRTEKHYRFVSPEAFSDEDLRRCDCSPP